MTVEQVRADARRMERYVCERILPDGPRRIAIEPGWVELTAFWGDDGDCELQIESNGPYAIGLREVYEHFRRQEMTAWEKERELASEMNRWRLHELERKNCAMSVELNDVGQAMLEAAPMERADHVLSLISALPNLTSIAKSLERIADAVDPPPADKVDTTYVAKKLGIGIPRVSQMASAGEIPPSCIVAGTGHGKLWKFHRVRIDQWIESR